MKSIRSVEADNKIRLLYAVIGYRRETEKIEKELKDWVKQVMGEEIKMQIGDFLVTRRLQSRNDLDRPSLAIYLGDDIKKFEKETVYEVLDLETFNKRKGVL